MNICIFLNLYILFHFYPPKRPTLAHRMLGQTQVNPHKNMSIHTATHTPNGTYKKPNLLPPTHRQAQNHKNGILTVVDATFPEHSLIVDWM